MLAQQTARNSLRYASSQKTATTAASRRWAAGSQQQQRFFTPGHEGSGRPPNKTPRNLAMAGIFGTVLLGVITISTKGKD
ncbi:unnamed protein product [Jaminaea pallidilutea]